MTNSEPNTNAIGRPSDYSDALAEKICEAIATSSKGLAIICKAEGFPDPTTIYRWLARNVEFRQRYARARELQAQPLVDELVMLADTTRVCKKITRKSDGSKETVWLDQVDRTRLQIDTRKWLLSKLLPKKYGDKLEMEHSGGVTLVNSVPRPKRD